MRNKKTDAKTAEKARLAAVQAQERIDEMATTSKYQVDEALQKASRAAQDATEPAPAAENK